MAERPILRRPRRLPIARKQRSPGWGTRPKGREYDEMRLNARVLLAAALIGLLAGIAAQASASSPHFKRGGTPKCTITGTTSATVVCTGVLAGLGNEDLLINTTLEGSAVYQCQNGGGNLSPGQNRVLIGPTTTPTEIDSDAIKNGNLTFTTNPATLTAPATVSGADAGCPNPNWTGVNPVLKVTEITLDIQQPVGTTIFLCSASNQNGLSGTVTLSC